MGGEGLQPRLGKRTGACAPDGAPADIPPPDPPLPVEYWCRGPWTGGSVGGGFISWLPSPPPPATLPPMLTPEKDEAPLAADTLAPGPEELEMPRPELPQG